MSIIIEDQNINAGVVMRSGGLQIDFADDAAFVLSETVLIDLMQRSIGIIYQSTYHHIGDLPSDMECKVLTSMTKAHLTGLGAGGQAIHLNAPLKIVSH